MNETRSLLAFGPAASGVIPPARPAFRPPPHRPSPGAQGVRLGPQFNALRAALATGRVAASDSTAEPDPELVVVFDLACTIEQFVRAVSHVDGLEFLAEFDEGAAEPDEDFYYEDKHGEATADVVPETLYMVMSNAQAVAEMVRLFVIWQKNPKTKFARGLAPLKEAFAMLRAVRRWDAGDRVRETGLLEAWAEDVAVAGSQGYTRVEIELWYRDDEARRGAAQREVERLIALARGNVISKAVIPSINYHSMLAELPFDQVEAVLQRGPGAIELLASESIMFVAPVRPMSAVALEPIDESASAAQFGPVPTAPPRVALLDGLPFAHHVALDGRLVIDDPDQYATRYTVAAQQHGTAMASLICNGDLIDPGPALSTQLYVRPIMEPHEFYNSETAARGELLVDLVHRAFHRMYEGDGGHAPTAPSVRIINLSIGDNVRVFYQRISPLAKLLDWLAHRYNVLILVSAGNHEAQLTVSADALSGRESLTREALASYYEQARHHRLLSPAEAVNVLTVGALHADGAGDAVPDTVVDPVVKGMPAVYSSVGFGYRRSVKPEILLPGGRQLFQRPVPGAENTVQLIPATHAATGPGQVVATPGRRGEADSTAYSSGTSNATALASRTANQIFDVLEALTSPGDEFSFPDPQYHPVLAKALLVHAASWGGLRGELQGALGLSGQSVRRDVTQMLGYGPVDPQRVASAARTRVVLLGAGSIGNKDRQRFSFPLPQALAATTEWRRLTVTLGWLSPVNPRSQVHRMGRLLFHPPEGRFRLDRMEADHNAARKGTVQHEVLEGKSAISFVAGDALSIDVDCHIDAGKHDQLIRFGIVASIEMAATIRTDVHAQVQQGLRVQVRQRQHIAARG